MPLQHLISLSVFWVMHVVTAYLESIPFVRKENGFQSRWWWWQSPFFTFNHPSFSTLRNGNQIVIQLSIRDQQSSLPETPFTARIRRRRTFHFRLLRDTRILSFLSFVSRQPVYRNCRKMERSTREGEKEIARDDGEAKQSRKRLAALETFYPFDFGNTVNSLWANLHSLLNGHCFTLARKDIPPSDWGLFLVCSFGVKIVPLLLPYFACRLLLCFLPFSHSISVSSFLP